MLFSSPRFFLFVAVLLALLAVPLGVRVKKVVLTVASCVFYAAWDHRYLALLAFVSVVDYAAAGRIHASRTPSARKTWLAISIVSNLAVLGFFKYANFFLDSLGGVLATATGGTAAVPVLHIILPAGISFYTFKSMSYTIDVYRREIEPCPSYLDYAMFITFFPELIAGPIVRASVFLPQMSRDPGPTRARLAQGLSLFLVGLLKKRLLADKFGAASDTIFASPELFSSPTLVAGALCYTAQIYCDFSAYSDMAIGTGRMIGYDLPENFDMPYAARDITEFWRRWHITLSSWLRDYLYIPLGGNRGGTLATYRNLFLTMLLGGLWHGAGWNFILWGALHGVALAVHRYLEGRFPRWRLPAPVSWAMTFAFVVLCWIPFRAPTLGVAWLFVKRAATAAPGFTWMPEPLFTWGPVLVAMHVLGGWIGGQAKEPGPLLRRWLERADITIAYNSISRWSLVFGARSFAGGLILTILVGLLLCFAEANTAPFIYFQF